MIDFPCNCGQYKFSVPDDMAGGLIQCPKCRRLNDVPLLSDLQHLDEDGSFKLEPEPVAPPSDEVVADMSLAYTRAHYDAQGADIDLRNTTDDLSKIGGELIPVTGEAVPIDRPKYDPTTGELIRPLDVSGDREPRVDPKKLPIATRTPPPVVYDDDNPAPMDELKIPLRLLRPINLFVIGVIFAAHLFSQFMAFLIGLGFLMVVLFFPVIQGLFLSHYGNVIDEIGPTKRNELPTPLRSLSWHEDTWGPFFRMFLTLTICYGPSIVLLFQHRLPLELREVLAATFAVAGTLVLPGALLTAITSGSWLNMRPDRLWAVIQICGGEYVLPLILWIVTAPMYFVSATLLYFLSFGFATRLMFTSSVRGPASFTLYSLLSLLGIRVRGASSIAIPTWIVWIGSYIGLIIAIFTMHWMCWALGTIYRRHHERFPWVYQRYHRDASGRRPAPKRGFAVQRARRRAPTSAKAPVQQQMQPPR